MDKETITNDIFNNYDIFTTAQNNKIYNYIKMPMQKLKPLEVIATPRYVRIKKSEEIMNNLRNIINKITDKKIELLLDRIKVDKLRRQIIKDKKE
tara:strand:+ start:861 stop:1145 length:285 start_codon:yes stop_codon:yes gene_type:complete